MNLRSLPWLPSYYTCLFWGISGPVTMPVCFCIAAARVKSRMVLLYNSNCLSPSSSALIQSGVECRSDQFGHWLPLDAQLLDAN